jgi:NAD(P)-dependent dehydrogenase (short-subunit alcohol dehydrogenase family)
MEGDIMARRNVVVTGGMGGLGEAICTKMADAGYQVIVTYSPGNTKSGEWLAGCARATMRSTPISAMWATTIPAPRR